VNPPNRTDNIRSLVTEPGNGGRYFIVYGDEFVALPDFGRAATMTPFPVEPGYIADKLDLGWDDAQAVFDALRADRDARADRAESEVR
jgi:hypothetical protein